MNPIPINAMAGKIPPAPVLAILSRYSRQEIEGFIAVAIDLLDLADGDSDQEGAHDEDEISTAFFLVSKRSGPGCLWSDPDQSVDDGNEDDSSNDLEACYD